MHCYFRHEIFRKPMAAHRSQIREKKELIAFEIILPKLNPTRNNVGVRPAKVDPFIRIASRADAVAIEITLVGVVSQGKMSSVSATPSLSSSTSHALSIPS